MGSHGRKIQTQYRTMSPEDQATFRRWVRLNAVVGFILAGGLIAMALAGNIGQSGMNAATAGTAGKVVAHAQAP
jgi:hypothetical protein